MRFVVISLLFFSNHAWAQEDWSVYLEKANQDAANCAQFLEVMEAHQDDNTTARGYFALATMLQAKLYPNPFTKLSYFNKGKKILEVTIESDPTNVELRFLRFAVQTEVPAILLYFGEIDEDQQMLDIYLEGADDALAHRIRKYYRLKGFDQKS